MSGIMWQENRKGYGGKIGNTDCLGKREVKQQKRARDDMHKEGELANAIHYEIGLNAPQHRLITVRLHLPASAEPYRLSMPAWIPGSYMIRDFARHVVSFEPRSADGRRHPWTLWDKQTWQLPPSAQPLVIDYQVYANDLSVRGAHFDTTHAFFNGTSLFLRWEGQEDRPHTVRLNRPQLAEQHTWRVATGMTPVQIDPAGFGLYRADDYETLIDHPFEVGHFQLMEFEVMGVPHRMVFTGAHPDTDFARIARDTASICEEQIRFFGGTAPFANYLFLVTVEADGYGGLEHLNSTALICRRESLPRVGEADLSDDYLQFLGLCSHEYFHSWNGKRIRPAAFMGLPLASEAYSRLLWVFEGFTSYYDDLFLLRAGLVDPARYLTLLADNLNRVYRGTGHQKQSLADASFHAWTRFYKQDENAVNAIVSYYTKGAMVALLIDLTLRRTGRASLDDLMQRLWQDYGLTGQGLPEGEVIEHLAEELAGQSLKAFFDLALRSTEPLPVETMLADFGVKVDWRPESEGIDIGAVFQTDLRGEARVSLVYENRPAARAGLCHDDIVIAVDGYRVDGANILQRLRRYRSGSRVRLTVFRRQRLLELELVPAPPPTNQLSLTLAESVSEAVLRRRQAWLRGPAA